MIPLLDKAHIAAYVPRNFVSSDDWRPEVDGDGIRQRATTGITDGTVILFHEWRKETLEQLPAILKPRAKAKGPEFLRVGDHLKSAGSEPPPECGVHEPLQPE